MNVQCSKCHALHFMCEKLSKSSRINPKFGTCCLDGKVILPFLTAPPQELSDLYFGQDPDSSHFLNKIRYYNNAFAMASLGVKIDHSVTGAGGPQVFKIQGGLYHNHGQLLPNEDGSVKYAQIYFFDSSEQQLNARQANNMTSQLKHNVLDTIQVYMILLQCQIINILFRMFYSATMYMFISTSMPLSVYDWSMISCERNTQI